MVGYCVRYMRVADVPQVVEIDAQSFTLPWSAQTYSYEITESDHSHMVVLERVEPLLTSGALQTMWRRIIGARTTRRTLLAYGGLWDLGRSTHISTIASHPEHRGKGFGELALVAMLRRSIHLNARHVMLEVRISNANAQRLYQKYGFKQRRIKEKYYHDNNEDAYEMSLDLYDAMRTRNIEQQYRKFQQRFNLDDRYTKVASG
jgi:ribosomal-protein-alanine N-acetyltransferase